MFSVHHQLLVVVCFVFFDFVNSQNNVLCELYQSTSISERVDTGHIVGWECVDGEPDSELCEEWSGVKCDRRGHVKYLDISGQNLTGTLPSTIGNLEHLKELYVDSNRLNGTIPATLSKLANLVTISLQNNELEGTIPSELGKLSKLKSLHLDHNRLTGSIPSSLGKLELQDLTASNNLLVGSLPASLAQIVKKGRVVDFSYNQLVGVIPVELCLARNMFLIENLIINRCNDICRDKSYRDGRIRISSSERGKSDDKAKQLAEEEKWVSEENEEKDLENFKKNLRNMVNL